eukprot:jgi/Mesen1/2976/ME000176S02016
MGTSVKFAPLCGAYNEEPLCYLLEVNGFSILLDCGWTDSFDLSQLEPLRHVAKSVDAVLLSHPDMAHLGALPYAVGKLGLQGTMYCTLPVQKLGQMCMYDHFVSRHAVSDFDLFTLDEVDDAFDNCIQLKYSQPQLLGGKGEGITITPYAAGHLLGGTVWKITKDTEDIVYAVDYNHRREQHLNGTVLDSFVRPTVLITDAFNVLGVEPKRKQRDAELADAILRTLRGGGNVLLPVDSAGRVFELLLLVEQQWAQQKLPYAVALLTTVAESTLDFAKSSLEWMSDAIAKAFEQSRHNPFDLKLVKLCRSRQEVDELAPGPRLVLASLATLGSGFARELFVDCAQDPRSLVLFTQRAHRGSLAHLLQERPPKEVTLEVTQRVLLEGAELAAYEAERALKKAEEAPAVEAGAAPEGGREELEESRRVEGQAAGGVPNERSAAGRRSSSSSTPMDVDGAGKRASALAGGGGRAGGGVRHGDILVEGFVPSATSAAPMFPFDESVPMSDEYGEVINPDDYIIKEDDSGPDTTNLQAQPHAYHMTLSVAEESRAAAEEAMLAEEKPSKVVSSMLQVQVRCQVQFLDFEGRADGRSMKTILSHVSPLKLILVHGSEDATRHLKEFCQRNLSSSVYAPRVGDLLDVTSDISSFKVALTEDLMSNVIFKKVLPLLPAYQGQAEFAGSGGVLRCGKSVFIKKVYGEYEDTSSLD